MTDQSLTEYIKQNLSVGFDETEIKQALLAAGWLASDIETGFLEAKASQKQPYLDERAVATTSAPSGFFKKHKTVLIISLVVIVTAPLLTYGGFLAYQKFFKPKTQSPPAEKSASPSQNTERTRPSAEALARDKQRITDIDRLQTALETYFAARQLYPPTLSGLLEISAVNGIPADPKTKNPYLYRALGDPALHYSLSFVLETDYGSLPAGLQQVSSESHLPAGLLQKQQSLVEGLREESEMSQNLIITDLGQTPFYPQEEVAVEVQTRTPDITLQNVFLVTEGLDLLDRKPPFRFTFTAPKAPGSYAVYVLAVDQNSQSYTQKTLFTVEPQ